MAELVSMQRLGDYMLLDLLGEGGMASVYRARHIPDEAIVAIKVLSQKLLVSTEAIQRFALEARLMQSFEHPHILPVYDFSQEEKQIYIVMKLLGTGSLNRYFRENRLSIQQIIDILEQVAGALDYAHQRSVIHRDLKPANVLMDADGNTYLSDFGIAKFKEETIGLTATGVMIGTPGYMAPEQWRSEPVDARTDVYAFGVMTFELFSGRLPFYGDTPFVLMYRHLDEMPPAISQVRRDLPKTVDRVIRRAMAKVPEHRYPSAGAVVAALKEALKVAEALPTPPSHEQTFNISDIDLAAVWAENTADNERDEYLTPILDGRTIELGAERTPPLIRDAAPSDMPLDEEFAEDEAEFYAEYGEYNAVDVGARILLERAKESQEEMEGEAKALAQAVVHYVQELREQAKQKPASTQSPYRALESYDVGDHKLFFGRELAIDAMMRRSPLARFSVLHAESGAGKTSLLRAGLMPRLLAGGFLPIYIAVRRRPPHDAIKNTLLPDPSQAPSLAKASLRSYLRMLARVVGVNREIFIFIDQFETFFTDVFTDEERQTFINEIAECLDDDLLAVRITLAMRTEYFGLLARFQPSIAQPFAHEYLLRPLNMREARRALISPALAQGYYYEHGLSETILHDLANHSQEIAPPQLQLVGGAMIELLPTGRKEITLEDYSKAGRAEGVLREYLSRLLQRFPLQERRLARLIIEGLVRADQTRDVRSAANLKQEFDAQGLDTEHLDHILHTLRENRVLRIVELENEVAYELVHDYLAKQVELDPETTARKAAQELLERRVSDYERYGSLLTEQELNIINAQSGRLTLTDSASKLITQTKAVRQRQRRRNIGLLVAAIVGIVATLALGLWSTLRENQNRQDRLDAAQTSEARISRQAQIAESGRVALQGVLELNENRVDSALLLTVAATRIDDSLQARSGLLTTLAATPKLHLFLYEHQAAVHGVAYHPDGTLFATAGADQRIILWDAATLQVKTTLVGSTNTIWALAFSPDGQVLASAGEDGKIRLWDMNTTSLLEQDLGDFTEIILSLAFSPDGRWLASGHGDGTIRLWEMPSLRLAHELSGHEDLVYTLTFSPDSQVLASGGADNRIILWDMNASPDILPTERLTGHNNWVTSLAFNPAGTILVSGSADRSIILWDLVQKTASQPISDHSDWVRSLAFSPDGSLLISASHDRTLILRNPNTGRRLSEIAPMLGHSGRVDSIAFSPDGERLISGGQEGYVLVWDIHESQPLSHALTGYQGRVGSLAYNSTGSLLASADSNAGQVVIWDTQTRVRVGEPIAAGNYITDLSFAPDTDSLAFSMIDGRLEVWDIGSKSLVWASQASPLAIQAIAFSPDGRFLTAAGEEKIIWLWDAENGKPLGNPFIGHQSAITSLAFSPDSRFLASAEQGSQPLIKLWDMENGQLVRDFEQAHSASIYRLAFNPTGEWLTSASGDDSLLLWDVNTGRPLSTPLSGHSSDVLALAISPDGQTLASAGTDDTLILWSLSWDANSGQFIAQIIGKPLTGHSNNIMDLAYSPDGRFLASGSDDASVRIWDVALDAWQDRACAVVNRDFSASEQSRFSLNNQGLLTCP